MNGEGKQVGLPDSNCRQSCPESQVPEEVSDPPSRALSFNVLMSQSLESQLGNHITLDDSGPSVLASVGGTAASEVPSPPCD